MDEKISNIAGPEAQAGGDSFPIGYDKRLLFIINPRAGTMQASKNLSEIVQVFSDAGYLTMALMTQKAGDGRIYAEKYAPHVSTIVCAGGDGTLNEIIEGVISSGCRCKIGYIPAGSTNDFAASVGLPTNVVDAAHVIVDGKPTFLDAGSFNGRYFSYVASFGAFASTSYKVPQNIKNIMGHNAYVLQGIRDFMSIKAIKMKLWADEGTPDERFFQGEYIFGAVCNATSVGGVLKLDSFDIDMNDGKMELLLIKRPENIVELNNIARSLLSGTLNAPEIKFFSVRNVRIEIEEGTHWTLDGEYEEGSTEVRIDTIKSAVELII
jgi:diacylglycerol kinase (ATP)